MIRKICAAALIALMIAMPCQAQTVSGQEMAGCAEDRTGCAILQVVMTGSFSSFDPLDSLQTRVFSAVFPQLGLITPDDLGHFCAETGAEEETVRREYYIALGNCLWADILSDPAQDAATSAARTVLHLFINPSMYENSVEQMEAIRAAADEEAIALIAECASLPAEFVEYLIFSEEWSAHPADLSEGG